MKFLKQRKLTPPLYNLKQITSATTMNPSSRLINDDNLIYDRSWLWVITELKSGVDRFVLLLEALLGDSGETAAVTRTGLCDRVFRGLKFHKTSGISAYRGAPYIWFKNSSIPVFQIEYWHLSLWRITYLRQKRPCLMYREWHCYSCSKGLTPNKCHYEHRKMWFRIN